MVGTDVTVTDGFKGTGTSGAFTLSTLSGITDSTGNWFVNTSVVGGSTEISLDDNPCYAAGTRILTATGERMIEGLMKGGSLELSASSPEVTLAALRFRKGARFVYEYDLNIPWRHEMRIEDRLEPEATKTYPV